MSKTEIDHYGVDFSWLKKKDPMKWKDHVYHTRQPAIGGLMLMKGDRFVENNSVKYSLKVADFNWKKSWGDREKLYQYVELDKFMDTVFDKLDNEFGELKPLKKRMVLNSEVYDLDRTGAKIWVRGGSVHIEWGRYDTRFLEKTKTFNSVEGAKVWLVKRWDRIFENALEGKLW